MQALNAQVTAVTDELATLRAEIIQIKSAHATLHQGAVEAGAQSAKAFEDQAARIVRLEQGIGEMSRGTGAGQGGGFAKEKPLIEAKQVSVEVYSGSIADGRSKFLSWAERVKDRVTLFEPGMIQAMTDAENKTSPITMEESRSMGISDYGNRQLHGFLKDRTDGMAHSLVRNNKSEVGLESWRLLTVQCNPKTLQNTMSAEHLERNPRGATKVSELPARLLEWERNLRRCAEEGREVPSDASKRLALLKMIPKKEREGIWNVAGKLYPTFADLLARVQEMIADDIDQKNGVSQMEVDDLGDEGEWKSTGQTLVGKGPQGEEQLFLLQRRGGALRVAPKGGKGAKRIKGRKGGKGDREHGGPGSDNKWDPNGCARCGRSSHWAKECTAVKDVNGEECKPKPKKKKGSSKGGRLHEREDEEDKADAGEE